MTIIACMMSSCVMTTVVDEIDEVVENSTTKSKSSEYRVGDVELQIFNYASNTFIQIDSLEICNILITDSQSEDLTYCGNKVINKPSQVNFKDSVCYSIRNIPVQKFTPWTPETLPQNSSNTYCKIQGKIYTFLANNEPFMLYSGKMYLPFVGKINANCTTTVKFELADNCPIYYETNGTMEKVIKSISFNITIDEWEE